MLLQRSVRAGQNSRCVCLQGLASCQRRTQGFCSEGGSTNSVEGRGQREQGSEGGSPLVRGSGCSCNLVQDISFHTVRSQKNGAVSKIKKKSISHLTRAKRTPSAAATVPVSHALRAVRFSCLLRGRRASFQDGAAAGKGFLCAPFWGVQIWDYSAAWVSCTV